MYFSLNIASKRGTNATICTGRVFNVYPYTAFNLYQYTVFLDKTITSGKKACFGGAGYLELPRELLPSSSSEMRVQLTVRTRSKHGIIYWQGQSMVLNGAGQDFFGIGLVNGFVKFR